MSNLLGNLIGADLLIGKDMAKVVDESLGEKTVLSVATSTSKSLRTTVPIGIVRQFRLKEGDQLEWQLEVLNGNMVIVVKPVKQGD